MIAVDLPWSKRLILVRKLIAASFLIGIALSYNLWVSERTFPLLPALDFLPSLSQSFNNGLALLLAVLLLSNAILFRRSFITLTVLLLLILLLEDQNRWQPWVYLYLLVLLPFGIIKATDSKAPSMVSYLQLLVIGVYAWSGIHKLNPNFTEVVISEMLSKLFAFEDAEWIATLKPWGYSIPVIEISIAIVLFIPRLRNLAVYAVIATHIFILAYLSPLGIGYNSVVYPWNLAMMGLVVLLFYNVQEPVKVLHHGKLPVPTLVPILLVWVMPLFNFWGYWDHYLSFSLYSGKTNAFWVVIGDTEINKVDPKLSQYFLNIEGLHGGKIIDLNKWAMEELNVPFYPETRALRKVAKPFCSLGIQEGQLYFLDFEIPYAKREYIRFTCEEVSF